MTETAKERIYREALEDLSNSTIDVDKIKKLIENGTISYFYNELDYLDKMSIYAKSALIDAKELADDTDKLSVEKLQEELESCIQTLIEASAAATITQDIVVGNLVDRKLADLAKTHKLAVDYIEKVTGKNIDVVLAENAALEAEEENE